MEPAVIPGPVGRWLFGNLADIDAERPMQSLCDLTREHGPIWKFRLGGKERIVIGSQALMNEVCDERRFAKIITASLQEARNGVFDGLGTAYGPQEENWGIAHRVLAPRFGIGAIRNMFDETQDIVTQLVVKWDRHGPNHAIEVADDFTRLTLDVIALCAMGYRLNSFYTEAMHPFVKAMTGFLKISGDRARRFKPMQLLCVAENQTYWQNIDILRTESMAIINKRKEHPTDKKDLLHSMLHETDPDTGKRMTDENIVDNMITFLIAGHETTSGLLSFTFYYLLTNPKAYALAQQEVDHTVGPGPITPDHLKKLPYINAVLRESLRLMPTVPSIALAAKERTVLGGKYVVDAGTPIIALFPMVHRDPAVYGSDADQFRPERMLDEEFHYREKQFPHCWKPFGNGMRRCIGNHFAWQQACLVVATLLQKFDFSLADPTYRLRVKHTLTIKPEGFQMRAFPRHPAAVATPPRDLTVRPSQDTLQATSQYAAAGIPVSIYHGGSGDTCRSLALELAENAAENGFLASTVDTLNSAERNLSKNTPMIIITASYRGQPATNAKSFVRWVSEERDAVKLTNVSYAVFGCGDLNWERSFQQVPIELDRTLEERGGERLVDLGRTDVARGMYKQDFKAWQDGLWLALQKRYGIVLGDAVQGTSLQVDVCVPNPPASGYELRKGQVVDVKVLASASVKATKHMEIKLPPDVRYAAGDLLVVLPRNATALVRRATTYFGVSPTNLLNISSAGPTTLPTDVPMSAAEVFGTYVELAQPATKDDILVLLNATYDVEMKTELARLVGEAYIEEVAAKRLSVLQLLEQFPHIRLPLGVFLSTQLPIRVRKYCISSSPLWSPEHVSLTYSEDTPPSQSDAVPSGAGSAYLSSLAIGDEISVSVEAGAEGFHLPKDSENVPLIMIATGTGLAPFRGFIQERAAQVAMGRVLAPAFLFYGCHGEDDLPYADALESWENLHAVSLQYAFSRMPDKSNGCPHVQDRVYHDKALVSAQVDAGARLLVCVHEEAMEGVRQTLTKIAKERLSEVHDAQVDDKSAEEWLKGSWCEWRSCDAVPSESRVVAQ